MCTLLSVATIGGVLACLLRHFRASLASLPLLGQPLGRLPVSHCQFAKGISYNAKFSVFHQGRLLRHFCASPALLPLSRDTAGPLAGKFARVQMMLATVVKTCLQRDFCVFLPQCRC